MKNKYKACNGCSIIYQCNLSPCCLDNQASKLTCPCTICLLKGICNKICEEFQSYRIICIKDSLEKGKVSDKTK